MSSHSASEPAPEQSWAEQKHHHELLSLFLSFIGFGMFVRNVQKLNLFFMLWTQKNSPVEGKIITDKAIHHQRSLFQQPRLAVELVLSGIN